MRALYIYLIILLTPLVVGGFTYLRSGQGNFKNYLHLNYFFLDVGRKINTALQVRLLKSDRIGNVSIGKEGWLFYLTQTNGRAMDDFLGTSPSGLTKMWDSYLSLQTQRPYGLKAPYVFIAPPNKETLYWDKTNLPYLTSRDLSQGVYQQIQRLFQDKYSENYISLYEIFLENKAKGTLYYPLDTHWAGLGSFLALQEIVKTVDKKLSVEREEMPLRWVKDPFAGEDIIRMIKKYVDAAGYTLAPYSLDVVLVQGTCCVKQEVSDELYQVYESKSPHSQLIWFVGDSFRIPLKLSLPHYYKKTIFFHYSDPQLKDKMQKAIKEHGLPNFIIEERVERHMHETPKYIDVFVEK